ncbi:MAG TPA: carboxypeptidase regulatory-like domain-containing protein, partial [Bryobacteraceae bacterium]|nr:carboxypeptidase regulatory-like domain-containing protein [Bryobacteraceae bacterium]
MQRGWLHRSWIALAVFVAVFLLMAAQTAEAQVLYGSITGNVVDPSQAAVPGAAVTITHRESGQTRSALTNEAGIYSFPNVPSGT